MAALYGAFIRSPLIWAISPLVNDSKESTKMHFPGILAGLIGLGFGFPRDGFLVELPNK